MNVYEKLYTPLIGKTIASLCRMPENADGEAPRRDGRDAIYGLEFSDGSCAWILADPEGNGPGFLQIEAPQH